jgi:uncharacterized phiE125 gp8 family phage protein
MKGKSMLLTELTQIPTAALPIAVFKDHLRLGTAFGADALQDGLLEAHLRAAIAAIEARIGKVILTRRYLLTLNDWRNPNEQPLPLAPVAEVVGISVFDVTDFEIPVTRYKLVQDTHRPKLIAVGLMFTSVPLDGRLEITFDAGFGAAWAQVPADLAQAVLLLAAQYYETRHDGQTAGLPVAVQSLIESWRNVRVLGGGAA